MERDSNFLKVTARLGLVFVWNQDDSLLVRGPGRLVVGVRVALRDITSSALPGPLGFPACVSPASGCLCLLGRARWGQRLVCPPQLELDPKYANQTCGLCGDFNGIPDLSEFHSNGESPPEPRSRCPCRVHACARMHDPDGRSHNLPHTCALSQLLDSRRHMGARVPSACVHPHSPADVHFQHTRVYA